MSKAAVFGVSPITVIGLVVFHQAGTGPRTVAARFLKTMELAMICPCGSEKEYTACCEPVIKGTELAATAEQLMRARYSAYTLVEMDFLFESLHPDSREENDREGAKDWAENSDWHGLEILATTAGGVEDEIGTVEFAANFATKGQEQRYHEVATFKKQDGAWFFADGKPGVRKPVIREEPKIGRNDPCSCGSGKKYKRCCGS